MKFILTLTLILSTIIDVNAQLYYKGGNGYVHFTSNAPLELIRATNSELQGVIKSEDQSFAFACLVRDFNGFNSPLQRHHFRENYMEMAIYPRLIFQGKIIEDINFNQDGKHHVRAKGVFTIHGIKREKIIEGYLEVKGDVVIIQAEFNIMLKNYDINIPKIVYQKISEVIQVDIRIKLTGA